ncbi:energy transducer TonB [Paenimyroides marinum]|nr:energy transducer TonB [Paenimyroides aquimaris]
MKVFLALIFGVFSITGFSQNLEEVAGSDKGSIKTEDVSLYKTIHNKSVAAYIAENYRYPQEAFKEGVSGTIYAEFVVEKDGTVKEVVIEKGLCAACDKEAVRVIKTVRMNPIEFDGEAVRIRFKIPIRLMLQE